MYKHVFIRKRKRKKPTMWIDSSAFLLLYLRIRINTRKPPFLTWSFVTNDWHKTWIVWPIAGVLYSVVIIFAKNIKKVD